MTTSRFVARLLTELTGSGQLLGADVIVAGMRPAVAITLCSLGLGPVGVQAALNAEQALARLGWRQTHAHPHRSRPHATW